jgi:hypothetical protein
MLYIAYTGISEHTIRFPPSRLLHYTCFFIRKITIQDYKLEIGTEQQTLTINKFNWIHYFVSTVSITVAMKSISSVIKQRVAR